MATTRSFSSMLNEYLTYDLLSAELIKRNYLINQVEKDNNWKGGNLVVPFKGGKPSSFAYGSLTAANDISELTPVRGGVSTYKEINGSMIWNAKDLAEHGAVSGQSSGMVSEQSFLKNLPDQLDDFIDDCKQAVSVNLLQGAHFAKLTSDATVNDGLIEVDHPERFEIDQKVIVDDGNSTAITAYVARAIGINMNTNVIKLVTTRGGTTVVDFSANNMTVAQDAKCYIDGAQTSGNAFTSFKDQVLSDANGGSAALFGVDKVDYPFLQAQNIDGSSMTASSVLEDIFDAWKDIAKKGKKGATDAVMGYDHLANIMKLLEVSSGPFTHVKQPKAATFNWTELSVMGVNGELKLVGVQEMDASEIFFIDWKGVKLHSNGMFRVQKDPEGKMYFSVRNTTGYQYIVDVCFYGELVVNRPLTQGAIHGITYV